MNIDLIKENMLGVLMYLFENHMQNSCDIKTDKKKLSLELRQAGFKSEAINKAFNWLSELTIQQQIIRQNPPQNRSFRIFTDEECKKLDKHCRNLLLYLEKIKILNSETRELVISQLMQLDEKMVHRSQIKWVTLVILFNQPDQKDALTCMESLILNDTPDNIQ